MIRISNDKKELDSLTKIITQSHQKFKQKDKAMKIQALSKSLTKKQCQCATSAVLSLFVLTL